MLELAEELFAGVEDLLARHRHANQAVDHGTGQPRDAAADRLHLLHPPLHRLRQAEQAERLAGGRGIDHDDVVVARVVVLCDPEQAADLVHARQDRHLLGQDLVEPTPAQDRCGVFLDLSPVAADVEEDVGLLAPQVRRHLDRLRAELAPEGVAQAMSDVGREDHGPIPTLRADQRRGSRHARLADPSLAGIEQDSRHRRLVVPRLRAPILASATGRSDRG